MSIYGEKMVADLVDRIEPGARVMTNDGKELGTVEAVEHLSIKVNAPLSRDYWLKGGYVVSYEDGFVRTSFDKSDLNVYKMNDVEPAEDPAEAGTDDIVPLDEQLETRRHMEEELARQRAARESRRSV
jgi:hypothetical protein